MIMASCDYEHYQLPLEEFQNCKNKMAASTRATFLARKVHKLKKMLLVWLRRPDVQVQLQSPEEIQNAVNEVLEMRLKTDVEESVGVRGDAIKVIVEGRSTLVAVNRGQTFPLPVHFVNTTPGRFSWEFMPSADNDICIRDGCNSVTGAQLPQQQTPIV